jgi:hypothetical protein
MCSLDFDIFSPGIHKFWLCDFLVDAVRRVSFNLVTPRVGKASLKHTEMRSYEVFGKAGRIVKSHRFHDLIVQLLTTVAILDIHGK